MPKFEKGMKFGPYRITLSAEDVRAYDESAGADASSLQRNGALPPIFPVAAALGRLLEDLKMGTGAVHLREDVEIAAPLFTGQEFTAEAHVKQASVKGGEQFLVIVTEIHDLDRRLACTSSSTVMVTA